MLINEDEGSSVQAEGYKAPWYHCSTLTSGLPVTRNASRSSPANCANSGSLNQEEQWPGKPGGARLAQDEWRNLPVSDSLPGGGHPVPNLQFRGEENVGHRKFSTSMISLSSRSFWT